MGPKSFDIPQIGPAQIKNPIKQASHANFIDDHEKLAYNPHLSSIKEAFARSELPLGFELAGARQLIYFNPKVIRVAIITCGGLCPGLNAVIRALVMHLWYRYDCHKIYGGRYGYQGLSPEAEDPFTELNPEVVKDIHERGGTILGSSRGTPPTSSIVDKLESQKINILFAIGGDGTVRGATKIYDEITRRGLPTSVCVIPKTIDNDIPLVRRSFGFDTAVSNACKAIDSAYNEAFGYRYGIGLVRLMGRQSGYIAASSSLATAKVNFCLVPEVDFNLDGKGGLLDLIEKKIKSDQHLVIVVAEGAGQKYFESEKLAQDASGNKKMGDIGAYLKSRINAYLVEKGITPSIKYIDPSYQIRSAPANAFDQLFCGRLAQNAVHAAMAGKTGLLIGYWHGRMTHVPLTAIQGRQKINPNGELWFNILETTGQPRTIGSDLEQQDG